MLWEGGGPASGVRATPYLKDQSGLLPPPGSHFQRWWGQGMGSEWGETPRSSAQPGASGVQPSDGLSVCISLMSLSLSLASIALLFWVPASHIASICLSVVCISLHLSLYTSGPM